jgi:hypothetical protein
VQLSRWERFAPLTGVVFFVLVATLFAISGDTPDADDSTQQVVSYWSDHDTRTIITAIMGSVAALFLVWFAGSLRSALLRAEGGEGRLSTVSFAGAVILAIAILIGSNIDFAIADTVGDVPAGVTQTLSAYDSDFFFPFIGGFVLMIFAAGLCALRFGALPRWLGWIAVVLGVLGVTPIGFFALLGGVVWIGVVGVVLYLGQEPVAPTTAAPPPAGPTG